nr:unnamed protein product [Spirometra erinaceieuropaei]
MQLAPSPGRSHLDDFFPVGWVDLQAPHGSFQGTLVAPDLASLSAGFLGDISIEELFGLPLVVHPHEVAAPAQLQLLQQDGAAEDSRQLQYVCVRDPLLPSQLQYPSNTTEVDAIEASRLLLVHRPGLRSIHRPLQDDRLVHLQFGVEMETMSIPDGALQVTEGLAGFGSSEGHSSVDLGVTKRVLPRYV